MKTARDDITVRELFEYSSEMFETIVDSMATKRDLDEVEARLTGKMDKMVTKDYLDQKLDEKLDEKLNALEQRLAAKINNLRIVSA